MTAALQPIYVRFNGVQDMPTPHKPFALYSTLERKDLFLPLKTTVVLETLISMGFYPWFPPLSVQPLTAGELLNRGASKHARKRATKQHDQKASN